MNNNFDGEFSLMNQEQINNEFLTAFSYNDIDKMKYLLISKDLKFQADLHFKENISSGGFSIFERICDDGKLDMIRFIFTAPELKEKINIHSSDNFCIRVACYKGFLDVVQFLVESPELEEHANIFATDSTQINSFLRACKRGHLNIIQYLLNNELYKNQLQAYKEEGFIEAFKSKKYELIHYFIFEETIEKTPLLENFLLINDKNILDVINKRDLHSNLFEELDSKQEYKKIKSRKILYTRLYFL